MLGLFDIPYIGVPQLPSYELSPAEQVLPGGEAPWDQAIQLNNTHRLETSGRLRGKPIWSLY